jgi:hypothetical protein
MDMATKGTLLEFKTKEYSGIVKEMKENCVVEYPAKDDGVNGIRSVVIVAPIDFVDKMLQEHVGQDVTIKVTVEITSNTI